jgi:hypothetical protein
VGVDGRHANPAAERNIVSGNGVYGILINSDCVIAGNFIGTDVTGTQALGNGIAHGAGISVGGSHNLIGTNADGAGDTAERNVISGGGTGDGIFLGGTGNVVAGNYIGTDVTGTIALGNREGVILAGNGNRIGADGHDPHPAAERNIISGNFDAGVDDAFNGSHNVIAGNFIGTDVAGTTATGTDGRPLGNQTCGILGGWCQHELYGTNSDGVGDDAERNIISGNLGPGILFRGTPGVPDDYNIIAGNYLGTDVTGAQIIGNGNADVEILNAGAGNRIGVDSHDVNPSAGRNIMSGGVVLQSTSSPDVMGTVVAGNYIGTDATGEHSFGGGGVTLINSPSTRIGTDSDGVGDAIERNVVGTVVINGPATGTVVAGNFIGTDAGGTVSFPNAAHGVVLDHAVSAQVGGSGDRGNTIAFSTPTNVPTNYYLVVPGAGVTVLGGSGNTIQGNSIFSNTHLGIDRGGNGVTANSPNNPNNFPVLSAAYASASTSVVGTFNSTPGTTFTLDFYANAAPDPSGYGEGQTYLGSTTVTTDASGNVTFQLAGLAATSPGQWVSATATGPSGTSEFAYDVKVTLAPTTTTVIASANTPLLGDSVTFTATVSAAVAGLGSPTGSVQFVIDGNNVGAPVPLVGSIASFTTSTLAIGAHTVTTTYSGDATFQTSNASTTVTVIPPASLSGVVFSDFNNDGQVDFGEKGISSVPITLTGTDDLGHSVNLSQTTDGAGTYVFLNLRPGTYTIAETQQPAGYTPGIDTVGTAGGTVSGAQFMVSLPVGVNAMNYNYGERPVATGPVREGQTAGIGFWNNKRGQALIKALNGGVGTQLGDWLAATFPHMFGALSGSNSLAAKNNAYVASFFQSRFVVHGQKVDAQVLATALAVYVTNATLDSTGVASQYGFTVSGNGVGTATYNVGDDGAAFGVANNTRVTVMDLLLAVDAQAVNGVLYNGDAAKRKMANDVFSDINEAGDA